MPTAGGNPDSRYFREIERESFFGRSQMVGIIGMKCFQETNCETLFLFPHLALAVFDREGFLFYRGLSLTQWQTDGGVG